MSRLVSRDPFARTELHREKVPGECAECGQWAGRLRDEAGARGGGYVYRYWVESDGGRRAEVPGLFCGEDCRRAYQGGE